MTRDKLGQTQQRLFDLYVKRVDLENALDDVQWRIDEIVTWMDEEDRQEVYKAVEEYFSPDVG